MGEEESVSILSYEEQDDDTGTIFRNYRMDFENKRIIGMVDGIDAAKQNMFKALQTRRYAHAIYDDQYGCDIMNKIGNLDLTPGYLESDIPAMIEEAFLNMEEIIEVSDILFEVLTGDSVHVSFSAVTIFGDTMVEGDINDG